MQEVPSGARPGCWQSRAASVAPENERIEDGAGRGHGAVANLAARRGAGRPSPFTDLEALRAAAGLPVSRFVALTGIPERTYRRRLARLRVGDPAKGPWPAPVVDRFEALAAKYAEAWPAWGYRKIAAMMRADGHDVSNSSVQRALRRRGLLLPQGFRADRKSWAALRRKVFREPPTERKRVWQTDFSEFETACGGIWRISAVIDYVTKYCLSITVTPTSRGADAVRCLQLAIDEAQHVLGLHDLRTDRGLMDVLDAMTSSSGKPRHPSRSSPTTGPAIAVRRSRRCSSTTIRCCATSARASSRLKPTAWSSDSSSHSSTSTSSAATSATETHSTWKSTDSASSTTPSDPTKHSMTERRSRPTLRQPENLPKP